jgi:hypothetical protein
MHLSHPRARPWIDGIEPQRRAEFRECFIHQPDVHIYAGQLRARFRMIRIQGEGMLVFRGGQLVREPAAWPPQHMAAHYMRIRDAWIERQRAL